MNKKSIKISTIWNLSDIYSNITHNKYQEDFFQLQEYIKTFKYFNSMKIHTFHTIKDFYLFYEQYEDLLKRFYKIQYFLLLQSLLNVSSFSIKQEQQKINNIGYDLLDFWIKEAKKIPKNTVSKLYKELLFGDDIPYKNIILKELYFLQNSNFDVQKFSKLQEKKEKNEVKIGLSNDLQERVMIYINQVKNFGMESKLYGFSSVKEYFLEGYGIKSKIFSTYISVLNTIFSNVKYGLKNKKYEKYDFSEFKKDLDSFIKNKKYKDIKKFLTYFLDTERVTIGPHKGHCNKSLSVQMPGYGGFVYWNFLGKKEDSVSFFHELGHCYQYFLAQHHDIFSQSADVVTNEISALYWEKIWKEHIGLSYNMLDNIYEHFIITKIEVFTYDLFEQGKLTEKRLLQYISHSFGEEWIKKFFFSFHVFRNPFYISTYIIAELLAEYFYKNNKNTEYERMCSYGKTKNIETIFYDFGEDLKSKEFYFSLIDKY